jgi:hypothetical protein
LDAADVVKVKSSGLVLNTNFLAQIQPNGGDGVVLVDGLADTPNPLNFEIWNKGQKLFSVPLYLSISGVEQMFRHTNLCGYGNGTVTVPSRASAPNEPPTNGNSFVFIHGYNVNQQEARGVLSEIFKRFYWAGSHASFYGVIWNGAVTKDWPVASLGGRFTPDYHTNVVNALLTAPHLADFLNGLSGDTTIGAHSLGNMVVLSAISDYNVTKIEHYFMIDSAVPMESVQGDTAIEPTMIYPTWQKDSTGGIYDQRLYASDWWQLFTNDYRSTLTWSNRLGNLGSVDIYNFYSSGEEVLRTNNGTIPSTIPNAVALELYYAAKGIPFGTYTWTWQELGKGTFSSDTFIGSTSGGWGFNDNSYGTNQLDYDGNQFWEHMSAQAAAQLSTSQLRTNAFFSLYGADIVLESSSGSAYAQAHRDRILSDAIPALTLPAGANSVWNLDERAGGTRNIDMQQTFKTGWPAARSLNNEDKNWHHSDFDYVAYPFTHSLFDEIMHSGNLK